TLFRSVGRNFIGHTGAVGIGVAAQAEIERAVLGDRGGVGAAGVGQVGEGERARGRVGVVDHHFNDIAGRAVAGRIGDDGAELIIAVGQAALARRRRRPGAAAVGRNFIGHTGAVGIGVAAQAEI